MRKGTRLCADGGHVAGASLEEGNLDGSELSTEGDKWMREAGDQCATTNSSNEMTETPAKDHDNGIKKRG